MPENWEKISLGKKWHSRAWGHGQTLLIFWLARVRVSASFVEFLGCALAGNCAGYFGILCGLKEAFYGEIKCGF